MAKILLTGCAGFIGSNTLKRLAETGYHVTGVDNLSAGKLEFIQDTLHMHKENVKFYHSSFDHDKILDDIEDGKFDTIIHLAAIPRIGYSIANPIQTHETNIDKTLNLIEAARASKKTKFIFASSSSIYGNGALPSSEDNLPDIKSPYALQKHTIEQYLRLYSELYGLNAIALRFFSVFGPNSLGTSAYATVVGAWLTAIKQGKPGILHGSGDQRRDFCYVDNVVDVIMASVMSSRQFKGGVVNVACGKNTSLNEIAAELHKKYPDFRLERISHRQADIDCTLADVTKAYELLRYIPKVDFMEGLHRTIKWYDDNWNDIKLL